MIIKLLSDSKETMWQEQWDLRKYETHVLIDEIEYEVYVVTSTRESKIWLCDSNSNNEITSGNIFDIIHDFWLEDTTIFERDGKKEEVYYFDGYKIFSIRYTNSNKVLDYNSELNDFKKLSELIREDINVIKYIDDYINEKEYLEGYLDLSKLTEIPETLFSIISKLRGRLELSSIETLTDKTALALSKHRGEIELSGIKSISDAAAEILSKHSSILDLSGLESISDISAEHLSNYTGILNLEKIDNISKEGISLLMNQKGSIICKGELYNEYRRKYNSSVRYEKNTFPEESVSFTYLNIVPQDGICLDIVITIDNKLYIILDKKKHLSITDFLQALGHTKIEILEMFNIPVIKVKNNRAELNLALGQKFAFSVLQTWTEDFVDEETLEVISVERSDLLYEVNEILSTKAIDKIIELPIEYFYLQETSSINSEILFNSFLEGTAHSFEEAQQLFYSKINESDPNDKNKLEGFINSYSTGESIDLGSEGRKSLNNLLNISESSGNSLNKNDYIEIVKYLMGL